MENIEELFNRAGHIYRPNKGNFTVFYSEWFAYLLERVINIFKWNGAGIIQHQIEERLLMSGLCGIAEYKKELTAFYATPYGVTKYFDMYTHLTVSSPVYNVSLQIGKDVIPIWNNSLHMPIRSRLHVYAVKLAHLDLTIINVLVNLRDTTPIIVKTEKQKEQVKEYRNSLFNGKLMPIVDKSYLGVQFGAESASVKINIKDLLEAQENILDSFFNEFGIQTGYKKKANLVTEEITQDKEKLVINISDMLTQRQEACKQINALFGVDWSVEKNADVFTDNNVGSKPMASAE